MKNYLTLVIGLVIVATPAFASRARLEALGESKNGSYYINDSRNMFYNPAFINDFKKKLFLEYGAVGSNSTAEAAGASKGQGGFTNTFGDFAYGLYLGNSSDTTKALMNNSALTGSIIRPDNAIDFFFGGDAGVKWGANIMYASNYSKTSGVAKSANQLLTRFGVIAGNLNAFANVALMTNAKINNATASTGNDEFAGKIGLVLGATYDVDNFTPYVNFAMTGYEDKPSGTKSQEYNATTIEVGTGYKKDVTKSTNLFSKVALSYATQVTKVVTPASESTAKQWNIPVTFGAETQALSWLAFRGSVTQSLLGQNQTAAGNRTINNNSTVLAAGAGLTFGDLQIDGSLANANSANANAGLGDSMLSRLGLTYNF